MVDDPNERKFLAESNRKNKENREQREMEDLIDNAAFPNENDPQIGDLKTRLEG